VAEGETTRYCLLKMLNMSGRHFGLGKSVRIGNAEALIRYSSAMTRTELVDSDREKGRVIGRLGRGHTKEIGNRNATAISENCYRTELNTWN
jgi:hypothetical protein